MTVINTVLSTERHKHYIDSVTIQYIVKNINIKKKAWRKNSNISKKDHQISKPAFTFSFGARRFWWKKQWNLMQATMEWGQITMVRTDVFFGNSSLAIVSAR